MYFLPSFFKVVCPLPAMILKKMSGLNIGQIWSSVIRTYLGYRYNNERTSSSALGDDCHELGVDSAEVVVMDILGDGDTFEALLPVGHFSVDISKLGASVGWTP